MTGRRLRPGEAPRDIAAEDVTRCRKCGARGHQLCDRYRLALTVVCPRDAMPRDPLAAADHQFGADLCAAALRGNDARFDETPLETDARFIELDFHAGETR